YRLDEKRRDGTWLSYRRLSFEISPRYTFHTMLWNLSTGWQWIAVAVGAIAAWRLARVCFTALATLPAMALTPLVARQLASWVKPRHYADDELFRADDAPPTCIERRRMGLGRLASRLRAQHAQSAAWGDAIRTSFSDLRFTDVSRVPFPFVRA